MATKINSALDISFLILLLLMRTSGFLDLRELDSVNYGIDILSTPVVLHEEMSPTSVTLTSIYGQQYHCSYSDPKLQNDKEKEEEKAAVETGISDLLKPMESGPCIKYTKDWWTYEFCYGQHIRQYHEENGAPSGVIMYLGYYESEFDWNNTTKKAKNRLNRYHSQQYVNGTNCDLTSKQRESEVRFMCDEGQGDYIGRIDEPATCVYVITVFTTKICHHPYLKPPVPTKPVPITCNPLLTQQEYDEYQLNQEMERQKAKEREERIMKLYEEAIEEGRQDKEMKKMNKEELENDLDAKERTSEEQLLSKSGEPETNQELLEDDEDAEKIVDNAVDQLQKLFLDSLARGLQEAMEQGGIKDGEAVLQEALDEGVDVKDPEQLRAYMHKLLSKKDKPEKDSSKEHESAEDVSVTRKDSPEVVYERRVLPEKAVDKFAASPEEPSVPPQEKLSWDGVDLSNDKILLEIDQYGHERWVAEDTQANRRILEEDQGFSHVKKVVSSEKYSKQENEKDDEEDVVIQTEDEDQEFIEEFEKGLDEIASSPETKQRLAKYKETIESSINSQFGQIFEEAQNELENEGFDGKVNKEEAFGQLAKTLGKLLTRLEKTEKDIKDVDAEIAKKEGTKKSLEEEIKEEMETVLDEEDEEDEEDEQSGPEEAAAEEKQTPLNDKSVKVRVTKIKHTEGQSLADPTGGTDNPDKTELKLSSSQKEELESTVKTELDKAGVDTDGHKIEVKIITAGYYDKDGDSLHILSDEESSQFNKMIVTILGGGGEMQREAERHQQMQNNYGFVWGKAKEKKQSTLKTVQP